MDHQFKEIVDKFIRMWASAFPNEAFREGMREYAGFLPNLSQANIQAYLLFLENIKEELKIIN